MIKTLDRNIAPSIIKLFDLCFRQGVLDAYEFHDDYEAKDFVARHKEAWDFAVLGKPEPYLWDEWRFTLFHWARMNGMNKLAVEHIYQITKKNPQWYLLPHCMCFYLKGIEEWLEFPDPTRIEIFKKGKFVHWKKMPPGLQKMDKNDIISSMHEFVFDFRRLPREERPFSVMTFDGYARAMHTLTRAYSKKKARIEIPETEDFQCPA